jgi:hypothetical protein
MAARDSIMWTVRVARRRPTRGAHDGSGVVSKTLTLVQQADRGGRVENAREQLVEAAKDNDFEVLTC